MCIPVRLALPLHTYHTCFWVLSSHLHQFVPQLTKSGYRCRTDGARYSQVIHTKACCDYVLYDLWNDAMLAHFVSKLQFHRYKMYMHHFLVSIIVLNAHCVLQSLPSDVL